MKPRDLAPIVPMILAALLCGCGATRKEPWETAPVKPGEIEVTLLPDRNGLRVERIRFFSVEMSEPRFFLALLPKVDGNLGEILILNHGWFDRPEYLLTELKVDAAYSRLLERNAVRPAIVILPDIRFPDFFRQNSDRFPFPNYLTLVAEECATVSSRHYAVPFERERWSIGGFSFGGLVALDVGRRYAGRFSSVSVVSAFADDEWTYWPSRQPPPGRLDAKGRGKHTLAAPGPVPRLLLACGTSDRFFSKMQGLHQLFMESNIHHEWSQAPGGHTWKYWSTALDQMLPFHLGRETGAARGAGK